MYTRGRLLFRHTPDKTYPDGQECCPLLEVKRLLFFLLRVTRGAGSVLESVSEITRL